MQNILDGIGKFQRDVFPRQRGLFRALSNTQQPEVLFITFGDSRVVPTLITQTQPGELFLSRQVGNVVPPHGSTYGGVSATIEYAVAALKVKHLVICGHSDCGAMKAVLHPERVSSLPNVAHWLSHCGAARAIVEALYPNAGADEKLHRLTEQNVLMQMRHVETHPPVAAAVGTGALAIHGWIYQIETGAVHAYNPETKRFEAITLDNSSAVDFTPAEVA